MNAIHAANARCATTLAPSYLLPRVLLSTLTLLTLPPSEAALLDLGNLPQGLGWVDAQAISGDGQVVVGQVLNGSRYDPFRWTAEQGVTSLGSFDSLYSGARAASADGSVLAGDASLLAGSSERRAFRWSSTSGFTDLGTLGGALSAAYGISNDGSVVVGLARNAANVSRAFRWAAGTMQDLGSLNSADPSAARGVSGDGAVVVGWSGSRAFRWTAATGMTDLGALGENGADAFASNRNGSVVVGESYLAANSPLRHAFHWSAAGGMQDIGTLGGDNSSAVDVNADGSVVVGQAQLADGTQRAFRWSAATGMADLGVLDGETESYAKGISDDGRIVVGTSGLRAFIWTDPAPLQDLANLQRSLLTSAATLSQLGTSETRRLRDNSSQLCLPGSAQHYCLNIGLGAYSGEADSHGNQRLGQLGGGIRLNPHISLGVGATSAAADLPSERAKQTNGYALNVWAAYQQNRQNLGWNGSASVAYGTSDNTFERGVGLADVQRARATTQLRSRVARLAVGYGLALDSTVLTPEIALSHARTAQNGFRERNVAFPLTVKSSTSQQAYASLGVHSATAVTAQGTLQMRFAVDALLRDNSPALEGYSQVPGLAHFHLHSNLNKRQMVPLASVGYHYAVDTQTTVYGALQAASSTFEGERPVLAVTAQYRYTF